MIYRRAYQLIIVDMLNITLDIKDDSGSEKYMYYIPLGSSCSG